MTEPPCDISHAPVTLWLINSNHSLHHYIISSFFNLNSETTPFEEEEFIHHHMKESPRAILRAGFPCGW